MVSSAPVTTSAGSGKVRANKSGTCIFCGSVGPLEREHVFPDWIRRALPVPGLRKHRYMVGPPLTVTASWQKPVATRRARCVCRACNRGWMKDLEDEVKPVLEVLMRLGTSIVPAGPALRTLAAWTFKTAAVIQELGHVRPIVAG